MSLSVDVRREGGLFIDNVPVKISDTPRFVHRGVLIDSARHFLHVSTILNVIDSLAFTKMNVVSIQIVCVISSS